MVELNHRDRQIKVKIVYYGPPVGGKTTNLQILHQHAEAARRGEMISINSAQDRTILFDLLPLRTAGFRGFDLRLQILAVPGQAMYATTRRLVLKNADSLVFVANSAVDRWEENLQSFREMTQNLLAHRLDPASMPLVFQYNKRDLPEVMDIEFMDRALNARKVDSIPAVAVRGEGVLETFSAILMRTVQDLAKRYSILETTPRPAGMAMDAAGRVEHVRNHEPGPGGPHPPRRVARVRHFPRAELGARAPRVPPPVGPPRLAGPSPTARSAPPLPSPGPPAGEPAGSGLPARRRRRGAHPSPRAHQRSRHLRRKLPPPPPGRRHRLSARAGPRPRPAAPTFAPRS